MQKLICSADKRIGKNGLEDFRNHPFFASIDWDNLPQSIIAKKNNSICIILFFLAQAMYVPDAQSSTDTNFPDFDFDPTRTVCSISLFSI